MSRSTRDSDTVFKWKMRAKILLKMPIRRKRQERLDHRTSFNSATSILLRLPPEIRNRIYHHVLCDHEWHMQRYPIRLWAPSRSLGINMLFVCKQMYAETSLLPFSLLPFPAGYLPQELDMLDFLRNDLSSVQRGCIRRVSFHFDGWGNWSLLDFYEGFLKLLPGLMQVRVSLTYTQVWARVVSQEVVRVVWVVVPGFREEETKWLLGRLEALLKVWKPGCRILYEETERFEDLPRWF